MEEKILIIEDDVDLVDMLTLRLACKGYRTLTANSGQDGLKAAYEHHPDLIILDVMMPGIDGFETLKRLRELSEVPVIMLTAKTETEDVVQGFRTGADDYVTKPFSVWELEERIIAVLRRSQGKAQVASLYDDGELRVDLDRKQIFRSGQRIHLTPTEFRLLSYLVVQKGTIIGHEELLSKVWGTNYRGAIENLSIYIHYLREKLSDEHGEHQYIRTEWGCGYWFAPRTETAL